MTRVTKRTIKKTTALFLMFAGFLAILFQKGFGSGNNPHGDLLRILAPDTAQADTVTYRSGGGSGSDGDAAGAAGDCSGDGGGGGCSGCDGGCSI